MRTFAVGLCLLGLVGCGSGNSGQAAVSAASQSSVAAPEKPKEDKNVLAFKNVAKSALNKLQIRAKLNIEHPIAASVREDVADIGTIMKSLPDMRHNARLYSIQEVIGSCKKQLEIAAGFLDEEEKMKAINQTEEAKACSESAAKCLKSCIVFAADAEQQLEKI